MDLNSVGPVVLISSAIIVVIAAIGLLAALRAWAIISGERKSLSDADAALTADDAWEGGYPHDKLGLLVWLRETGIKSDSHIGDFIRTCWSAWLGGRPASLTELHMLVARRERSRSSARLSAGISALLLVFGIVGTLASIKPVLGDFRFAVSGGPVAAYEAPERQAGQDVATQTEKVNQLIRDLGNAFWPSLLALAGTIGVVSARGLYVRKLNQFTLELDRFAVDTLIPRYRVVSLSEQYQDVRASLVGISESILQRESRFEQAVEKLVAATAGLSPSLEGLQSAATASKDAAERLSSSSESVTVSLEKSFGSGSPLGQALAGLDEIFQQTLRSVQNLSDHVEGISNSHKISRAEIEVSVKDVGRIVRQLGKDSKVSQDEIRVALHGLQQECKGLPDAMKVDAQRAIDSGLKAVTAGVGELANRQKEWHAGTAGELRAATEGGLRSVTMAAQEMSAKVGEINSVLTDVRKVSQESVAAVKAQADEGKSQMEAMGRNVEAQITHAAKELTRRGRMENSAKSLWSRVKGLFRGKK